MTHGIVRAPIERVSKIGARDDPIISRERREVVTLNVFVGTDKRAAILTSMNRRSTGARDQRQDGNDQGNGRDHVGRLGGEELW